MHSELIHQIETYSHSAANAEEFMTFIVQRIQQNLPDYNWVGFYMLDMKGAALGKEPTLVLGPYVGAPTPHTRIPLNQGICGAAVTQGQTIVVDDVNSDPRYLACSLETKSEIVVPVRVREAIVGELDIDSHKNAAFTPADRDFCEQVADILGRFLERNT